MDETDFASVGELASTAEDGSATIDKENLQKLFDLIGDDESTSFSKIQSLAAEAQTSADLSSNTYQKDSGQDIVVTFGGLQWQVMYLSQTKADEEDNVNTILTLWLTNNTQEAWKGENNGNADGLSSNQGKYYGFYNGGLFSDWSSNWYNTATKDGDPNFYPSNMYGTSYIRAVTLNNGGQYATSNTAMSTASYTPNESSVFAKFTMPNVEGSLTKYIVKPVDVKWQEIQSAKSSAGYIYNFSNDAWSTETPNDGFYIESNEPGRYNYAEHNGYDTWKNDYIWLPSLAETDYSGESAGLWKTSTKQRANYDGTTSISSITGAKVGGGSDVGFDGTGSSGSIRPMSWLRSGYGYLASYAYYLFASGSNYDSTYVMDSLAVRPSLHLNLDSAALAAGLDIPAGESTLWADHTEEYKGEGMEGNGTQDNPYIIDKAEKLAKVAENANNGEDCDAYFKLTNDIYLGGWRWTPIGNETNTFNGNFDGAGHTIYGLKIRGKEADQGLFGRTGAGVSIKSLTINGGNITTRLDGYVGSLIGRMSGTGTVTNCSAIGVDVDGLNYTGGLIGYADGNISNVTSSCEVSGNDWVGGVLGYLNTGKIVQATSSNQVSGHNYVGGIVGRVNSSSSTIESCRATSNVIGNDYVGGGIGYNDGELTNISFSGTVEGNNYVGGGIGYNNGKITILSSAGDIEGNNYVGGAVGYSTSSGTLSKISASGRINAGQYVGGIVGYFNSGTMDLSQGDTIINGSKGEVGGLIGYMKAGTVKNCISQSHINASKYVTYFGGLVGYMTGGTLTSCAGFGSLYGDYSIVGCLVGYGNSSSIKITACSFVGDTDNKVIKPFVGTGSVSLSCCYSVSNHTKYISNDTTDAQWATYFSIVEALQALPVQRDLYHIASIAGTTFEELAAAFADFEVFSQ